MHIFLQVLVLVVCGWVLTKCAHLVVREASKIARNFGTTNYVMAFMLLGILTSTPEIFVAIESSLYGAQPLSVGNLLGGSILLLTLVFGLCSVFLKGVAINHGSHISEIILNGIVIVSPVFVLWDGTLTRVDGALLTGIYLAYVIFLQRSFHTHAVELAGNVTKVSANAGLLLMGLIGMLIASKYIVTSALAISDALGISTVVFGLIILSLGTNLPELSLAYEAIRFRHKSIALGDFMGSASANTLILGLMGMFAPYNSDATIHMWYPLIMLVFITFYFIVAIGKKMHLSRTEGIGLLLLYGMFVLYEFLSGR